MGVVIDINDRLRAKKDAELEEIIRKTHMWDIDRYELTEDPGEE